VTEAEWLTCIDAPTMLRYLQGRASDRKLRLFSCACCRRVWHLLTDPRSRAAIEVAERFVDGAADQQELLEASNAAWAAAMGMISTHEIAVRLDPETYPDLLYGIHDAARASPAACAAAYASMTDLGWVHSAANYARQATLQASPGAARVGTVGSALPRKEAERVERTERTAQARLLVDLVGNPFGSVNLDRDVLAWNGGIVRRMAQAIYDELAFDRLPILSDALLEAGCDDEALIAHCRGEGPHVRGCWAVDLLLGKG
jgi:hypothetical protein